MILTYLVKKKVSDFEMEQNHKINCLCRSTPLPVLVQGRKIIPRRRGEGGEHGPLPPQGPDH